MSSKITPNSPLTEPQRQAIASATPGGIQHVSGITVAPEVHNLVDKSVIAAVVAVEATRDSWYRRFPTANTYNQVNRWIAPIIVELHKKGATLTPHIQSQIAALPVDPPKA